MSDSLRPVDSNNFSTLTRSHSHVHAYTFITQRDTGFYTKRHPSDTPLHPDFTQSHLTAALRAVSLSSQGRPPLQAFFPVIFHQTEPLLLTDATREVESTELLPLLPNGGLANGNDTIRDA